MSLVDQTNEEIDLSMEGLALHVDHDFDSSLNPDHRVHFCFGGPESSEDYDLFDESFNLTLEEAAQLRDRLDLILTGDGFFAWLRRGIDAGWTTPTTCSTHDGFPTTAEEDEEFDEGDPCVHVVRLCGSREEQDAVRKNRPNLAWPK